VLDPLSLVKHASLIIQAHKLVRRLKDEGYKVILINSNPATIMTDPDVADKTYIEPITLEVLEKILKKEKPDAILPTMGGQTALNLAMEAEKKGILKKYKIELIGANSKQLLMQRIGKKFRKNMIDIGLDLPKSEIVNNINQASKVLKKIGLTCNHKTCIYTWRSWWWYC
jgi:carbamoyl-phosphate synthase large subunit